MASEDVFSLLPVRGPGPAPGPRWIGSPVGWPARIRVNRSKKSFRRLGYLLSVMGMQPPNDSCFGQFSGICTVPDVLRVFICITSAWSQKTSSLPHAPPNTWSYTTCSFVVVHLGLFQGVLLDGFGHSFRPCRHQPSPREHSASQ